MRDETPVSSMQELKDPARDDGSPDQSLGVLRELGLLSHKPARPDEALHSLK
jgi:hypothetical protein